MRQFMSLPRRLCALQKKGFFLRSIYVCDLGASQGKTKVRDSAISSPNSALEAHISRKREASDAMKKCGAVTSRRFAPEGKNELD
ncbi:MAG: hypothetical protein ACXVB9_20240, partial [Bdellovibrionota bacterium]